MSLRGIGALLATQSDFGLSDGLLIGVPRGNGEYRYAGVAVRHLDRRDEEGVFAGGEFGGTIHEILEAGTIAPVFRPERMEFAFDYAGPLLDSLEHLSVLKDGPKP